MDFEKRKFLHNVTLLKYIAAYRDPSLTTSPTRLISLMHGDSDMDRVWIIFLHIVTACPNSNCICVLHFKDGRCPRGIACGIVNGVLATFVDIAANSIGFRSLTKQKLEEISEICVKSTGKADVSVPLCVFYVIKQKIVSPVDGKQYRIGSIEHELSTSMERGVWNEVQSEYRRLQHDPRLIARRLGYRLQFLPCYQDGHRRYEMQLVV